jgi:hypothetical protein
VTWEGIEDYEYEREITINIHVGDGEIVEGLRILSVPDTLGFGTVPVTGNTRILELSEDWEITVLDTITGSGENWELAASAGPIMADSGSELHNPLFYRDAQGNSYELTDESVKISEKSESTAATAGGIYEVRFTDNRSIFIMLDPFEGEPGATYATAVTWTLSLAP